MFPALIEKYPELESAYMFAVVAHGQQKRRYTEEPYVNHCVEVAAEVIKFTMTGSEESRDRAMVLGRACLLHDTIEDTDATYQQLRDRFGDEVTLLVFDLTDAVTAENGNRATRKWLQTARIIRGTPHSQLIKIFDIENNTKSIAEHDPAFFATYEREVRTTLEAIIQHNAGMYAALRNKAQRVLEQLDMLSLMVAAKQNLVSSEKDQKKVDQPE